MPCGGCSKRRAARASARSLKSGGDITAGLANLTDKQIKARLEVYKKRFCPNCKERYTCDFVRYTDCRKLNQ